MLSLILACALTQEPLALERILPPSAGLVHAVDMHAHPVDGRILVAEQEGRIRIVSGGAILPVPFLDFTGVVFTSGDVGLRAFCFHPQFAVNGEVFVWYDADNGTAGCDGVLERLTVSPSNPDVLDMASREEILRVTQDGRSHGGGTIQFDASGMLNLAIGDGKPGGDQFCRAQDPSVLLGKMLRIDVDAAAPYGIPADNPFVGISGVRPEIVHLGLRHPWKWSFDPVTGATWIADVGQAISEEVDYVPPGVMGLNFGWSYKEGTDCFAACTCPGANGSGGGTNPCIDPSYTDPVFEYGHNLGCSITGGPVYRGSAIPSLDGRFIFADFCTNRIWSAGYDPGGALRVEEHPIALYPAGTNLILTTTLGVDAAGEILVADYIDGSLYRIAPPDAVQSVCAGMPNGVGAGANLNVVGSTSIAANSLSFRVTEAPPFSLGLLFYGPEPGLFPSGNGQRCVAQGNASLFRVNYRVSGGGGQMVHPVDFNVFPFTTALGAVQGGSTWYFQSWYRDLNGPGGQGTNYSSAIAVRFRP